MSISFAPEAQVTRSSDKPVGHNLLEAPLTKFKSFVSRLEPGIAAHIRTEHFFSKFNLFGSGYFRTGAEDRYFKKQFKRETLKIRLENLKRVQAGHMEDAQIAQKIIATEKALIKVDNHLKSPDRMHIANESSMGVDAANLARLYEQHKVTLDKAARDRIQEDIRSYIANAAHRKTEHDFRNKT